MATQREAERSRNSAATARARKKKAARRRQQAIIRMVLLVLIAALVIILAAFGIRSLLGGKGASDTTLTVKKNGAIVFEEWMALDDNYLNADEMKDYVKDVIAQYNSSSNKNVKLKDFKEKGGSVYCRTEYPDADTYYDFTSYYLYTGKASDLSDGTVDPSTVHFMTVAGAVKGNAVDISEVLSESDAKLLVIEENVKVVVPGNILYVTDACTAVTEKDTVMITPPTGGNDAAVKTIIVYK